MSLAGSGIAQVVLPILVFQLSGSASLTALLLTIEAVPYLVFGLLSGAVADRVDRRRLMVGCDLVSAAAVASVPLAAVMGSLTLAHIYVAGLVSATCFVWFDSAEFGALPAIVGRKRIVAATSVLASSWELLRIVAPAAGGAMAAAFGAAPVLWLDALSYLASAAVLARIRRPFRTVTAEEVLPGRIRRRLRADIGEGLRFIRGHPLIRPLTLLGFGASLTSGAIVGLLVVYGARQLSLGDDDARLGWLFSATGVGALGAALAIPRLARRWSPPRITLVGLAVQVPLLGGLASSTSLSASLALLVAWQAAASLVIINGITLRQQLTPDHLQGRVNVTARMIAWGGHPIGAAIGGLVADHVSIRATYLIMAVGVTTSALIAWLSPLRRTDARTVADLRAQAG